jgi:LacI family transcriptional regulator
MERAFDNLRVDPHARVPIAVQLAEQVAWLIASEKIVRNDRLPPIRALASRLGVNMHTVSAAYRQLESDGLVSTRRGRGTIVLGYDRSRRASHAPDVPTSTVGVLISEHSDFTNPILEGLQASGEESAVLLLVGATHDDPDSVAGFLDRLVAKSVDGMILASLGRPENPDLAEGLLHAFAIPPIVYLDLPDAPGPKVLFDLETGASNAVGHLLDHGYNRVGLVSGPPGWPHQAPLRQGHLRAHEDHGVAVDPELVFESRDLSVDSGREGAAALLGLGLPPRAILAASFGLAIGVIRAIREAGMRIPEEIALICCEDPATAALVDPPLTAVHLPAREMGRQAMAMLATLIHGGTVRPSMVILPTRLIVRRSCGCGG